jgi:outer membrane protein
MVRRTTQPVIKRVSFLAIGLSFLAIFANSVQANSISLGQFLETVQRSHPMFEGESLTAEIARHNRDGLLGAQDWIVSAAPGLTLVDNAYERFDPSSIVGLNASATAQRRIWDTGGRLDVSWGTTLSHLRNVPFGTQTPNIDQYRHELRARYTHPLGRNARGALDRLQYDLAKYNIDVAEVTAQENEEAFLLDLAVQYVDWATFAEELRIAGERMELAEEQLSLVERKRRANLVDQVDVLRGADAVRAAELGMMLAKAQWAAQRGRLAVLAQQPGIDTLEANIDLYERIDHGSFEEASKQLRQNSRLLRVLAIRRDQLEHRQEGYEETLRDVLSVNGELALVGGGESAIEVAKVYHPDARVSLQFSRTLDDRSTHSAISRNRVQIRQIDLRGRSIILELQGALRSALVMLEEFEDILALNEQQIETAQAKTREELRRYNQGRGDLNFVILSQDSEQLVRLTYARNASTYQKLRLQVRALLDDLLPSSARPDPINEEE